MKRNPVTWIDAKGQIVYIKGSKKNRTERLTKEELDCVTGDLELLSGTVTTVNGKVFYAPFHLINHEKNESGENHG